MYYEPEAQSTTLIPRRCEADILTAGRVSTSPIPNRAMVAPFARAFEVLGAAPDPTFANVYSVVSIRFSGGADCER